MSFEEVKDYYAVYRSYFYTVAVLIVCAAVAFALIEIREKRLEAKALWPQAKAEIVESTIKVHGHIDKYNPHHGLNAKIALRLRYQLNGTEITAYLIDTVPGPLSWDPEKVFAVGLAVTVRYNPEEVKEVRLYHSGLAP